MIFPQRFFRMLELVFPFCIIIIVLFYINSNKTECNISMESFISSQHSKSFLQSQDEFYNLLPANFDVFMSNLLTEECCNEEYINSQRLQQNHPCVIEIIRRKYLHHPPSAEIHLHLDRPKEIDPSAGQSAAVLPFLNNKTKGFFVECGAGDGESLSNTLYMERQLNWKGILIEANHEFFSEILARRRKVFALPVCISHKSYPTKVFFYEDGIAGMIYGENLSNYHYELSKNESLQLVKIQCFPLYSILLAVGKTQVDYFSLDVEGSELQILMTIPWQMVDIKTLTVEVTSRRQDVVTSLSQYMRSNGYKKIGLMQGLGYYDLIFVKR